MEPLEHSSVGVRQNGSYVYNSRVEGDILHLAALGCVVAVLVLTAILFPVSQDVQSKAGDMSCSESCSSVIAEQKGFLRENSTTLDNRLSFGEIGSQQIRNSVEDLEQLQVFSACYETSSSVSLTADTDTRLKFNLVLSNANPNDYSTSTGLWKAKSGGIAQTRVSVTNKDVNTLYTIKIKDVTEDIVLDMNSGAVTSVDGQLQTFVTEGIIDVQKNHEYEVLLKSNDTSTLAKTNNCGYNSVVFVIQAKSDPSGSGG